MARRRRRKAEPQAPLPALPVCPYCGAGVLEFVWESQGIRNYECKECNRIMDNLNDAKILTTSMGKCVVVTRLELVDTKPEILASGLPVLLEADMERFKTEPADERKKLWHARVTACDEYRERKARNPNLTIDSPWVGA